MLKSFTAAALCGLLLLPLAARAQDAASTASTDDTNLRAFLTGTQMPLSLKMRDLTPEYRSFVLARSNDTFLDYMRMVGAMQGLEFGRYYTTGQTATLGGQEYLVCYRPQTQVDPRAMRNFGHGDPVVPLKPGPDDALSLSLIDLKTAGGLNDVRRFDPKREMRSDADGRAASMRTLAVLGQGFRQAIRARGDVVPTVGDTVDAATRRAFYPQVHDERTWRNPATDEFYAVNPAISGLRLRDVQNAKYLPAFYEAEPSGDGSVGIVFLDGHTERATPERWERYQEVEPIMKTETALMADAAVMTPRIKTALGATAALRGSSIDVDTLGSTNSVALRGTVTTQAQKALAENVAKRNAPGYRIINQLRVSR